MNWAFFLQAGYFLQVGTLVVIAALALQVAPQTLKLNILSEIG